MKTLRSTASAALAAACLFAALPASASDVRVMVGDLDLSTGVGATQFDARVDRAARRICRGRVTVGSRLPDRSCREQVRAEVLRQIDPGQREAYETARARRIET